jgi:UDP-N-acetyl-D-glucosamine dehydrogenase
VQAKNLLELVEEKSLVLGVVGLGYVGIPLAHSFVQAGVRVIGFDADTRRAAAASRAEKYLDHLPDKVFTDLSTSGRFSATSDMSRLSECNAVLICVPTPLGPHGEPDMSYIESSVEAVCNALTAGQLIVLESTTYPGTTREILAARVSEYFEVGVDVFVAYSPEREDPGRAIESSSVPKLIGGVDPASSRIATALYALAFDQVVPVSSAEVAEAAKILENTFRSVNIGLVNEMKSALMVMGVDIWEVVAAAATKPYGFMPFYPGPGVGGHCIPVDPFYLTWKAREFGHTPDLIELSGKINRAQPSYVVSRVAQGLNEASKPLRGSKVLIVGMAYKPNVGDTRESPSVEIAELLIASGAEVSYHDPHAPIMNELNLRSVALSKEELTNADAVVVLTAHDCVDWSLVARSASLVVDTRNALAPYEHDVKGQVLKA